MTNEEDDEYYLKPAPGFGQPPATNCKHELLRPNEGIDLNIYHFICDCGAKFHKCAVDEIDGKLQLHDFKVKRGKRSAKRRV